MKSMLAGLTLLLFCSASMAQWVKAGTIDGVTVYMEPTRIDRSVTPTRVWALSDLATEQHTARGRGYLSQKAEMEIDCLAAKLRVLRVNWYAGRMGAGESVFYTEPSDSAPTRVVPGSQSELIWRFACSRK